MMTMAGWSSTPTATSSTSEDRASNTASITTSLGKGAAEKVQAAYKLCCACIAGGEDPLVLQALLHLIGQDEELVKGLKVAQSGAAMEQEDTVGAQQVPLLLLACAAGKQGYIEVSYDELACDCAQQIDVMPLFRTGLSHAHTAQRSPPSAKCINIQ